MIEKLLFVVEKNPSAKQAYYAEQIGVSKRTVSRIFASLQAKGILVQNGTRRKSDWLIKKQEKQPGC
ncbi:MAG: winged helix-turn-helix transcriptional regulator [Desulfovibrionaceae bacterium]|nr:winged helix-turn-helix transcriptional regulator [Desulfovibrionaceae bacterium]